MNESMKIVIGYDGSECANNALNDLQLAGLPPKGKIVVVSVSELWLPEPPPSSLELVDSALESGATNGVKFDGSADQAVRLSATTARQAWKRLQAILPGWEIQSEGYSGSAARQILNKAEEWKPDLIVVGSHGRSGVGNFLMGSVSQKIVTESLCSVRVARGKSDREYPSSRPVRIAVGFDGFSDSKTAVNEIARRNWPKGSEVRLITAIGPFCAGEKIEDRISFAHFLQQNAQKILEQAGLTVSHVVKEIDPKHLLLNEAKGWDADCIFVGTSNLSRFERVLLGSISSAVVTRAHCSVEVVRQEAV
jgi:nucleotide-binding universal stress UspA family protein